MKLQTSDRMVQLLDIHYRKEAMSWHSACLGGLNDKLRDYFAGNLSIIDTLPTATGGRHFSAKSGKHYALSPAGR